MKFFNKDVLRRFIIPFLFKVCQKTKDTTVGAENLFIKTYLIKEIITLIKT